MKSTQKHSDLHFLTLVLAIGSGFLAIYLSSSFASTLGLTEYALPLSYPTLAILAFFMTGILLMATVMLRPSLFWPILISTSTITAGMVALGFSIFDEWLAGCIVAGGILACVGGFVPVRRTRSGKLWPALFVLMSFYFFLQSFLGLLIHDNPKAWRLVMDFALLLTLLWLLVRYEFPIPTSRTITWILAGSVSAYFALYIVHGFLFQEYVWLASMEGIGGAGSSFAALPVAIGAPAAIILLRYEQRSIGRLLGWLTVSLCVAAAFLSDSRAGLFGVLIAIIIVAPIAVGAKLTIKLWIVAFLASGVVGFLQWSNFYTATAVPQIIETSLGTRYGSREVDFYGKQGRVSLGDTGRYLLIRAAVQAIADDPMLFFFGSGTYGYWPVAGAYMDRLREDYGVPNDILNYGASLAGGPMERPRPPTIAIIIMETGVLGVILFLGNVLMAGSRAIFSKRPNNMYVFIRPRPMLLIAAAVPLSLAWGFSTQIQSVILFYILLMPHGLIDGWVSTWESWQRKNPSQERPGTNAHSLEKGSYRSIQSV